MKRKGIIGVTLIASLLSAGSAFGALKAGPGNTPFWIETSYPQQIDRQVAQLLADYAMVIVLRTPNDDDQQAAEVRATVGKLKQMAPQTPVLMYAWASRNLKGKSGSAGVMDWLDGETGMLIHSPRGQAYPGFGDVTLESYRAKAASSIASAVNRGGFDGVALDLAIRTPRYRPGPLVKLCAADATFCSRYARGMDATFDALRDALANRAIVYNGLWNFGPDSVEDQQQLLGHSDAAIVEFFGGDPRTPLDESFSRDIFPYVQAMAQTPENKKILVFGRGSWEYKTYAEDYAWQRYLYCAYLLGARTNTYFKYHAQFQLNPNRGRSGALSVYADGFVNLGPPMKAYSSASGLYSRPFTHGMVIVAPDDGGGGGYDLPHTMYSPEGDKYEGRVTLRPAEGLLLLNAKPSAGNDQRLLDLKLLADWPGASLSADASSVSLKADAPVGSHDMLLDAVRSLHPSNMLQLAVEADGQETQLQAVAEVDDPSHRYQYAVVEMGARSNSGENGGLQSIGFRLPTTIGDANAPVVAGPHLTPGVWQTLNLDGHAIFANSGLTFRRWDYARFNGALKLKVVKLMN